MYLHFIFLCWWNTERLFPPSEKFGPFYFIFDQRTRKIQKNYCIVSQPICTYTLFVIYVINYCLGYAPFSKLEEWWVTRHEPKSTYNKGISMEELRGKWIFFGENDVCAYFKVKGEGGVVNVPGQVAL